MGGTDTGEAAPRGMDPRHFPEQVIERLLAEAPGGSAAVKLLHAGIRIRRNPDFTHRGKTAEAEGDPVAALQLIRHEHIAVIPLRLRREPGATEHILLPDAREFSHSLRSL